MGKNPSSIHDLLSEIKEKEIEICILTLSFPYYEIRPAIKHATINVKIDFVGEDYFLASNEHRYPISFLGLMGKGVI
jgi:hypothetical protein